ncbi:dihydrolipoyl dehydrogenase [Psychrobacter sp. DAB_AL62B]|uniref:dihydrolipoyl dehydrogenase n=1 Tax=Psychrobacter sp. DAB_AL62B TaxID=1028420 RepID=UPI0023814F70|nr:dihydrolipoyl dehydrogenase [Psychrobacter sp. DAB_AL62B]MDE4455764.1 dihydrolipoyl dehydrogenase [Psychrobacter sp. DAB_AL62B]
MNKQPDSASDHSNDKKVTRKVSVAIIGAGTAGQNAFRQARKIKEDALIINDGFWTTTCIEIGCMPSKLLIAAADRAYDTNHSSEFGVHASAQIDGKQVMERVRAERSHFASYIKEQVDSWPENNKIAGRAHINKQGLIEVNDELIEAEKIIVATGSSTFIPDDWAKKLGKTLLTSDTVFELADLPKSMAVVGAGAIGLELAQAFTRLGVDVTLFNQVKRVAGLKDDDINNKAIDCLSRELTMHLGSKIINVGSQTSADNAKGHQENGDNAASAAAFIDYEDSAGASQQWQGEYVLVATGRRNNIDELGVENLGVELDKKNRPKQLDKRTGKIGDLEVYIVGDANANLPLLHVASDEGFSAGSMVCDNKKDAYIRPPATPFSIVFCSPQIVNVGMSLPEIQEDSELEYVIGKVSFDNQGRSRVMGVNCGLLHIYGCKKTDRILGASMVAPDAEYIGHILAMAITNDLSIKDMLDMPFYHPTILEGLRTALHDVQQMMRIPYQSNDTQQDNS